MQNCPTDGLPLCIGNNHGKGGTHTNTFFRTDSKGKIPIALLFSAINDTFHRYSENFSQMCQCFDVRLGLASFP